MTISLLSKTFCPPFIDVIKNLIKRFVVLHGKKVTKTARVEACVLNSLTPISKSEICKIHPDISSTTVEVVLGTMLRDGLIKIIGSGRSSKYIRNKSVL